MEGLAVAASVTGILTFAIQSSKVIWEALNGIKDGPADVEHLVTAVSNLRLLLEQLEDLWKKNDRDGGTLSKDLEVVIGRCAFDLDQFRKQIDRLQVLPDKKAWKRTWRSLKFVLEKERLHSMRMVILQHHGALEGHLALANYKSNIDQREQLTRLLTDTTTSSQEASSEFHLFLQNFQTATTQNNAFFESISKQAADHQANQEVSNQASEDLRKDILTIKKNVETGNIEIQKKLESTSQSLDSLGDRMHRLSIGFSEGQIKTLTSMLTSLQSQIPTRDPKDSCPISHKEDYDASEADDTEESGRGDDSTEAGHRLTLSLFRLARIAKDARTIAPSQEAQSVLEALETIVDLMTGTSRTSDRLNLKRKKAEDCDSIKTEAEQGHEQKRIKGLLTTSQSIILNPKASNRNRIGSEYRVKRLTGAEVYQNSCGNLSIVSTSQNISSSHYHHDDQVEYNCQHTLQQYAGKATFWTKYTVFPYKINATVLQNLTCNGYSSLNPTLSYHAMMPFDSDVFVTVRTGNLFRLKHLLEQRKASLTDCDPDGRSLLSYATYYEQPDMCKYLIGKGVDLDCFERTFPGPGMIVPLAYHFFMVPKDSSRSQACHRLLLLAGADPLIGFRGILVDQSASTLEYVAESGTPEELSMILYHASVYVDPEQALRYSAYTVLLYLCSRHGPYDVDRLKSLRILLTYGVNVNATDEYGNSAIHLSLRHLYASSKSEYGIEKEFFKLLLQSTLKTGANLHLKNHFGIEASQVVYGHFDYNRESDNYLPQRILLWNEALIEMGLNTAGFRSCRSKCLCQNGDLLNMPLNMRIPCDSFKKGAYLDPITLGPLKATEYDDEAPDDGEFDDEESDDEESRDEESRDEESRDEESRDEEVVAESYRQPLNEDDNSIGSSNQEPKNNQSRPSFEIIESDDETYEDAEEVLDNPLWSNPQDKFHSNSSYRQPPKENPTLALLKPLDFTNAEFNNPETDAQACYRPSSCTTTSNQHSNNPTTPDSRSKTFWNVI